MVKAYAHKKIRQSKFARLFERLKSEREVGNIVLYVFVSTFHSLSLCGGRGRSESACSFGKCRFTSLVWRPAYPVLQSSFPSASHSMFRGWKGRFFLSTTDPVLSSYVYIYIYMCVCVRVCKCVSVYIYVYVYVYIYTLYTCIYIYIYIHVL